MQSQRQRLFFTAGAAHAITAKDVLEKMGDKERFGYVTGLVDMLSYQAVLANDRSRAECIVNEFYNKTDATWRLLTATFERYPTSHPKGLSSSSWIKPAGRSRCLLQRRPLDAASGLLLRTDFLKPMKERCRPLRMRGGCENGALVLFQNPQPAFDVGRVIRPDFWREIKIGRKKRRPELRDQLFHGVAFIAEARAAEVAVKPRLVARPVSVMPISA